MNAPFVIQAGLPVEFYEPGDFFRILASAGPVDVRFYRQGVEVGEALQVTEGYAERWRGLGFDRFIIASATTQTLQVVARLGSDVYFDAPPVGSTDIVSSVPLALDAATIAALLQVPTYGASFDSTTALGAGATEQVFAAAANVNGAVIWSASWSGFNAGAGNAQSGLIAAAAAPGSFTAGDVLMHVMDHASVAGSVNHTGVLQRPVRIPAGLGLWFRNQTAETAGARAVLYTLL